MGARKELEIRCQSGNLLVISYGGIVFPQLAPRVGAVEVGFGVTGLDLDCPVEARDSRYSVEQQERGAAVAMRFCGLRINVDGPVELVNAASRRPSARSRLPRSTWKEAWSGFRAMARSQLARPSSVPAQGEQ